MYLSLVTILLALVSVISTTPTERLHTNINVTTLREGMGATQPAPILPRVDNPHADHFPSDFEIQQSISAYSMLLNCQFAGKGSVCQSPLNKVDELIAFCDHMHNVLQCRFKPGSMPCAINENVVSSMERLFEYAALLSGSPASTSISSPSSTAASSTVSVSSAPSPSSTTLVVVLTFTPLSSTTPLATRTSSSSASFSSFTSLSTATSLSTLMFRKTLLTLSTATSLSTSTLLFTSTIAVPSVHSSTPSPSLSTSTLLLTSTVRVPSLPSSTPFFNGNLTIKRSVQRGAESQSEEKHRPVDGAAVGETVGELFDAILEVNRTKPAGTGKVEVKPKPTSVGGNSTFTRAAISQPVVNTTAGAGSASINGSTFDISLSSERKGAIAGIIVNAAANAITATVQDAIAEDKQEDGKKGSDGKDDKEELKVTRRNRVVPGKSLAQPLAPGKPLADVMSLASIGQDTYSVTDPARGLTGVTGASQEEQSEEEPDANEETEYYP